MRHRIAQRFPQASRRGFTLVELLVVMAIIAVLTALLLPGVRMVKDSARSGKCASNLRQIFMGAEGYAFDCDGYLPHGHNAIVSPTVSVVSYLDDYIDRGTGTSTANAVWTCPVSNVKFSQFPLTYGCNLSAFPKYNTSTNPNPAYLPPKLLSQIPRRSEVICFADASQSSGAGTSAGWLDYTDYPSNNSLANSSKSVDLISGWDDTDTGNYHLRYRHRQNANLVFFDGHVGTYAKGVLTCRNISTLY